MILLHCNSIKTLQRKERCRVWYFDTNIYTVDITLSVPGGCSSLDQSMEQQERVLHLHLKSARLQSSPVKAELYCNLQLYRFLYIKVHVIPIFNKMIIGKIIKLFDYDCKYGYFSTYPRLVIWHVNNTLVT